MVVKSDCGSGSDGIDDTGVDDGNLIRRRFHN